MPPCLSPSPRGRFGARPPSWVFTHAHLHSCTHTYAHTGAFTHLGHTTQAQAALLPCLMVLHKAFCYFVTTFYIICSCLYKM